MVDPWVWFPGWIDPQGRFPDCSQVQIDPKVCFESVGEQLVWALEYSDQQSTPHSLVQTLFVVLSEPGRGPLGGPLLSLWILDSGLKQTKSNLFAPKKIPNSVIIQQ